MDFQVEDIDNLRRRAAITFSGTELQAEEDKAYSHLRKTTRMPGFRPGKVPKRVLRQMHGRRIRQDAMNTLIDNQVRVLVNKTPDFLHLAEFEMVDERTTDGGFRIHIEFEVKPDVEATGYLGLEVTFRTIEVTEDMINEALENLREQFATLEPVEDRNEAAEGDLVTLDLVGQGIAEAIEDEGMQVELGSGNASLPGLEEALVGATVGEAKDVTLTLPTPYERAPALGGQEVTLSVTPTSLQTKLRPDMDDDLALETGEAETFEELREKVAENLKEQFEARQKADMRRQVVDGLITTFDLDVPAGYVRLRAKQRVETDMGMMTGQQINLDDIGDQAMVDQILSERLPEAKREVAAEWILDAIATAEGVGVEGDDIRDFVQREAGRSGMPPDQFAQMLRTPQMQEMVQAEIRRQKTLDVLLANAKMIEAEDLPEDPAESSDAEESSDADATSSEES